MSPSTLTVSQASFMTLVLLKSLSGLLLCGCEVLHNTCRGKVPFSLRPIRVYILVTLLTTGGVHLGHMVEVVSSRTNLKRDTKSNQVKTLQSLGN